MPSYTSIRPYQLDDGNIVEHGERNPIETILLGWCNEIWNALDLSTERLWRNHDSSILYDYNSASSFVGIPTYNIW